MFTCRKNFSKAAVRGFSLFFLFTFLLCCHWKDSQFLHDKTTTPTATAPTSLTNERAWYFEGGTIRPKYNEKLQKLWPNEAKDDRIVNQLMFVPEGKSGLEKKKIYFPKLQNKKFPNGSQIFSDLNCPVQNCEIIFQQKTADAVVFENFITEIRNRSSIDQVWILHSLESPLYSGKVIQQTSVNWTASYRLDSDLVTPYDKWVYYDENIKWKKQNKNYAEGKSKKVAWFVSNCRAHNKRLEYARVLGKFIPVDIYGRCGDKVCMKTSEDYCRKMISKEYKFYLAFENANCRDYITEKFYLNALRIDVIPIVMGAPREDYEKVAPYNSFIHVEDFQSPKHLADYLNYLDKNDDVYNSYFEWKGSGEFINTFFMCRLCGMLHAGRQPHFYKKINQWWKKPGTCTKTFWNEINIKKILKSLKELNKIKKH